MGDGYQEVQEVISIHAPTRGATSLKATEYKLSIDFNPRSHERSDNIQLNFCALCPISIHAPTRGATVLRGTDNHKSEISIHAPTRGATQVLDKFLQNFAFQSTLPREERLSNVDFKSIPYISIHAPTRGATKSRLRMVT